VKTLERSLTLPGVIAISIGAMIGGGLFVLPGMAAAETGTGPSIWLAYLVAGLCVLPAALSKSELATAMPTSGGTYVYLERAFGPLTGTIAGLGLWLSLLLKSSFALVGFSAYLYLIAPDLDPKLSGLVLLGLIVGMNIVGVKAVSTITKVIVVSVIIGLIGLCVYSLGNTFDPANLRDETGTMFSDGAGGFILAVAFVYLSFAGVTKVAAIAEEVKNPGRNLPMGILISLAAVTIIYAFVVFVMMATVPEIGEPLGTDAAGNPTYNLHPVYTFAQKVGGPKVAFAIVILCIVTMTSMALAGLLASSRFPFAMSRDSLVPKTFQSISPRFMTPIPSILATGLFIGLTILFLEPVKIAKLTSAFKILVFGSVNLAVIVLRESNPQWYKPTFKSPLYPWVQILGILIAIILLFFLGLEGLVAMVSIVAIGVLFYLAYGLKHSKRLGEVGKRGRRHDLLAATTQSHHLEAVLPGEASVVVPLFGHERSPEILVEMGAVLADGRKIEVLEVTEVPDQTILDAVLEEDVHTTSLRRRLHAMAEEEKLDLEFTTTVSRDVVHTIHHVANRLHSEWVAMEWRGRRHTTFTIHNPIGWLQDHLPCNLALFKDTGIRYVRKILVVAEPGPHDALVVTTADHMASLYKAELYFARFDDSEHSEAERHNTDEYLQQMRLLCAAPTHIHTLTGASRLQALEKSTAEHDLMVLAAPPNRHFMGLSVETMEDRLIARSACDVLALKTGIGTTHELVEESKPTSNDPSKALRSALDLSACALNVPIKRQDELFAFLGQDIANTLPRSTPEMVTKALLEREQMQSTSLGMGLAVPHANMPMEGKVRVVVVTLEKPINYKAPDKQKVDIIFAVITSPKERQIHLNILSEISRLALNTSMLNDLRLARTKQDLASILQID
jgi:APA family basic amino acid/polyamine antiporter